MNSKCLFRYFVKDRWHSETPSQPKMGDMWKIYCRAAVVWGNAIELRATFQLIKRIVHIYRQERRKRTCCSNSRIN